MLTATVPLTLLAVLLTFTRAQECGTLADGSRIVGGEEVGGYKYPFFAFLEYNNGYHDPGCGGTLISDKHVLSAAHCFGGDDDVSNEDEFVVVLGLYDRCVEEETRKEFSVAKVNVHEDYVPGKDLYDIALMTLKESAAAYTPACLPPPGKSEESEPALIMGYGDEKEGANKAPCKMREANITKYSTEDCRKTDLPSKDVEQNTTFCAGAQGKDTCQGDSGGPLFTFDKEGKYVVAGIVSYGYGCAVDGYPGVYTNVGSYLDWIKDKQDAGTGKLSPRLTTSKRSSLPARKTFQKLLASEI